jgi:3-oxoacyl-[acyl-carrier-protein] synthase II
LTGARNSAPEVVVTGIGVVGPHGTGTDLYWSALLEGRSGIRRLEGDLAGLPGKAGGLVPDFDPAPYLDRRSARRHGRFAQFAVVASRLALEDAGIAPDDLIPDATGITIHTGAGGNIEGDREVLSRAGAKDRTGPLYVPLLSANMAAANVAIHLGVHGPVTAGVGACAAGAIAVAEGFHMLQRGDVDVVLAGATDAALTPYLIASLANAGALTTSDGDPTSLSRPFDAHRTGFVPSEGAAMLVLERADSARARGHRAYCSVAGVALGCDAFHITSPEPTGAGAELVMRRALRNADLSPDDLEGVIAHGTGTTLNDAAESAAIGRVLGERSTSVPTTAPKSVAGHTLGAAGAFAVATGALALREQVIPPTLNYETPDPGCRLRIVSGAPLVGPVGACMVNAFGFGGQNAVVILTAA